jgi:DNA primase large subunit
MKEFNLEKLTKYPFLKEAKEYVASLGLTLGEIRTHQVYSESVELGRQRVHDALKGEVHLNQRDRLSQELCILSYAVARIIVNLTKNKAVISRYASVEAENIYGFLVDEKGEVLKEVMLDLNLGLDRNRMRYPKYLRLSTNLARSKAKWMLVNRIMDKGYVRVDESEIPLLLREAVRLRVMEPVDVRGVPSEFREMAKGVGFIRNQADVRIEQIRERALPPCITAMLASLESGSTSHNAMFILGTFFLGLGLDVDDVVKIFSRHPRFNEEKTRNQLGFLSGEKSSTRYNCPSCSKIKSYGLCKKECGVKHPLKYYRNNVRG